MIPQPHVTWLDNDRICLLADYEWDGEMVPCGFVCDGASIPQMAYGWATPLGEFRNAAIFHDHHYTLHKEMLPNRQYHGIARAEADRRFYLRLRLLGIRTSKAWLAWIALRLVGGIAWRG
jgi:hypothetical protein